MPPVQNYGEKEKDHDEGEKPWGRRDGSDSRVYRLGLCQPGLLFFLHDYVAEFGEVVDRPRVRVRGLSS